MRPIKTFTALFLLGAMLVTADQVPAPAADFGCDDSVGRSGGAHENLLLQKRGLGFLGKAAGLFGKAGKFGGGAGRNIKPFAGATVTFSGGKAVTSSVGKNIALKSGESAKKAGFLARNGVTGKRLGKEFLIGTGIGLGLNIGFNEFLKFRANQGKQDLEKNATIAADLASKGELTEEKAAELGVQFDELTGQLLLPPGLDIVLPPNANPAEAGAAPTGGAAPVTPEDIAKQLASAKEAVELACQDKLTAAKCEELGCSFIEATGDLQIPAAIANQIDVDAICAPFVAATPTPAAGAKPAAAATATPATSAKPAAAAPTKAAAQSAQEVPQFA